MLKHFELLLTKYVYFWSFRAIFHIIIYTDPPHTYSFCIMTNLIMGKTVPLELVTPPPPFPQCFTSCGIAFMHITAILVNNSFIIHDFQLNNARDSFVNLFYPSLVLSFTDILRLPIDLYWFPTGWLKFCWIQSSQLWQCFWLT